MNTCPKCGSKIDDNDVIDNELAYCRNCGNIVQISKRNREDIIVAQEREIIRKMPEKRFETHEEIDLLKKVIDFNLVSRDDFKDLMNSRQGPVYSKMKGVIIELLKKQNQSELSEKIRVLRQNNMITNTQDALLKQWIK